MCFVHCSLSYPDTWQYTLVNELIPKGCSSEFSLFLYLIDLFSVSSLVFSSPSRCTLQTTNPGHCSVKSTSFRGQQLRGNTSACTGKSVTRECICMRAQQDNISSQQHRPEVEQQQHQQQCRRCLLEQWCTGWVVAVWTEKVPRVAIIRHRLILIANCVAFVNNLVIILPNWWPV